MTDWFVLIMSSLACFRFTRLITDDKITDWLRRDVGKAGKKAKEGISCPFCVSGWISLVMTIVLFVMGQVSILIVFYWGAMWGASVLWNQIFMKLSK